MSMKNSSDTTMKQTRDLLVCSAVPQPTVSLLFERVMFIVIFWLLNEIIIVLLAI